MARLRMSATSFGTKQKALLVLVSLAAMIVVSPIAAHADSSSLDTTCNTTGFRSDALGQDDVGQAIARQADGKLLVAGSSDFTGGGDLVVIRYNTNCTPDSTFGPLDQFSGFHMVRLDASGAERNDGATGIAVQPDGRIVVAGFRANATNDDAIVVRLTSAGALDDTFDGDGISVLDTGANERASAIALQPNGRIVIGGYTDWSGNQDSMLARFNTNGTLDNTFNGVGWRAYDVSLGSNVDQLSGVQIQTDGAIVASGYWFTGGTDDMSLVRVKTNGLLDTTFSSDGIYTQGGGGSNERATGLVLDGGGNITYSAWTNVTGSNDFYVEQVSPAGLFLGSNFIDFSGSGSSDQAFGIAMQPDGKFVLAGASDGVYALARVSPPVAFSMDLDTTFNGTGLVTTSISGSDEALAVLVQPDGRIVAAGVSNTGSFPDFSLARYQGSPLMKFSASSYSVNENVGHVTVTVQRVGATQDAVSVHAATSNGTAGAGSDYTAVSTTLNFAAGVTSQTFNVNITNDGTQEGPETINLDLSSPGGTGDATLGSPSHAVITIKASDQKVDGHVKLSGGSYIGNNVYNSTGASQTSSTTAARGQKKTFYVEIQNDGNVVNSFKVKGGNAPSGFKIAYFAGTSATNITKYVLAGTYSTGSLAVGAVKLIRVEITVGTTTAHGALASIPITGTWSGDGFKIDVVKTNVKVS